MATTTYGTPYVSGTDLVANWPAASLTVANSIDSAGYYIGRGISTQTGSMTTVLTDAGKTITMSNASANTVTIPANSSVAYVVGTRINILNLGAGACTPTAGAGVTISGTITALATNSSAAVIKTATNTWSYVPFGSGGAATLTSGDVTSTTGSPTITTSGGFTIYSFDGSGTITTGRAGLCTVLLVAGGGSGEEGGGGAGGMLPITDAFLPSGTNTVTIGAGGQRGNGVSSRLADYFAVGGGYCGAGVPTSSTTGGSGGGGRDNITFPPGLGTPGQGNNGGQGTAGATGGGGGGGAGAVGATGASGGAGGAGAVSTISGSSVTYSAGGAGGGATAANGAANTGNGAIKTGTGGSGKIVIKVVT